MSNVLKAITLIVLLSATYVQAEVVVIVNTANETTSMSRAELGRIFLGKSQGFPNGKKAVPLNQILASSVRRTFDDVFLGKTESQIKSYWSRQLFSGEGTPPEEVNGDLDVVKKVALNPDYIGYVDEAAINDAVKIVKIE